MSIENEVIAASAIEGIVIDVSEASVTSVASREPSIWTAGFESDEPERSEPQSDAPRSDEAAGDAPRAQRGTIDPHAGPLAGRVAVVTGGADGVGRTVALEMASAGARVCVVGADLAKLRETVDLAGPGAAILYLQCDLGSVSEIEGVVDFIERFDRPIDLLVHAEGVQVRGGVERGSVTDLDEQYLVNVRGPYVMSQQLIGQLRASRGHVIFLNSPSAMNVSIEFGQFSVANHGLRALADVLREELRPAGVRVTSVFTDAALDDESQGIAPADIASCVMSSVLASPRVEITDIHLRPRVAVDDDSSL